MVNELIFVCDYVYRAHTDRRHTETARRLSAQNEDSIPQLFLAKSPSRSESVHSDTHTNTPFLQTNKTRMWANAQRDGRPAECRWRPLFNAAKFGLRPLLECRAVMLPRCETR